MPPTQQSRFLAIETKLGKDKVLLKNFSMNEQLGRLFQMEVELRSEDRAIKFEDIVGTSATVKLKMPNGQTRCFNGVVSRFVQMQYQGSYAVYRATLVPWFWLLTRTADCRIFQNKKVPDIIEKIFKDQNFKDYKLKLSGSYHPREYCVQYRETDFNFVSRLMEQEGIYYFFEHQDGKHTLVLADSPSAHEPFAGYDTLVYRPPTTRQEENKETVTDWVMEKEIQPGMYAVRAFNFRTPKAAVSGNASVSRQYQGADYEVFDYPGDFANGPEGESYAKLRIQELQAQYEILRAQATVRGVASGYKFTLKGHPRSDQNRAYLITGASLQATAGEYESRDADQGDFYSCSFTAIPASEPFRAPRTTPKPLIRGPQSAIVVGPSGQKIYTDPKGYGMVKVHFHWDRHDQRDENSSCWVRVSQAWAGKNWGDMALPHVGDEVIVECLEGDPDRPIITGRVYNATNMPPLDLPTNKDKRILQDDYGNKLVLDATPGDEHIRLLSPHHNSGITLGRGHCDWSESNKLAATLGDALTFALGTSLGATTGASGTVVMGTNVGAVVGTDFCLKLASQISATLGPQFCTTGGLRYEKNESDFFNVCEKDVVISAGGKLNLVGGGRGKPKTSIVYADDDAIEMTVGDPKEVDEITYKRKVKEANIAAAVLPVAAAACMGVTGVWVSSYHNNEDAQYNKNTLIKQGLFEVAALVVQIASWVAMGVGHHASKSMATSTKSVNHSDDEAIGRLRLKNDGEASLKADKQIVLIGDKDKKSNIQMDASAIKIEHTSGDVILQAGTNTLKVSNSGVEIGGSSVKIGGTDLDFGGGALTIMGSPAITASTLAAALGKMEADNKQLTIKRDAYLKAQLAKRRAMLTGR